MVIESIGRREKTTFSSNWKAKYSGKVRCSYEVESFTHELYTLNLFENIEMKCGSGTNVPRAY